MALKCDTTKISNGNKTAAWGLRKLVMLHLSLGDLCTEIWLNIAPHLAAIIRLVTAIIDHFIWEIISLEREVVPLHGIEVATLNSETNLERQQLSKFLKNSK